MADILSIGISGLKAQQTALTVTGNNITNAGNEGYSRQRVSFAENNPSFFAGVWVGSGVNVDSVERVYDAFLTSQLRIDTTSFNQHNTIATNASQIDRLLADPGTGLQPGLERLFGALQASVDDPASLPAREVFISEAKGLVDRFSVINDRLVAQNQVITGQMQVIAGEITSMGKVLADLNQQIAFATANAQGDSPSAMLDQRDRILKNLSEMIEVRVVAQDDNSQNVFIGNGQALVVGTQSNEIVVDVGESDPRRVDVYFQKGESRQNISQEVQGGMLGGILEFRDEILNPTLNNMGRLALAIGQTINDQHKLGIDYNGIPGSLIFNDINDEERVRARVLAGNNNPLPEDRLVTAHITDPSAVTVSDYRINFVGPDDNTFRVTRLEDNQLLTTQALSSQLPATVAFDGVEVHFEEGSFQKGDSYLISPTRFESNNIDVEVSRAEQIALASPIITDAAIGNRGNGIITEGSVYDMETAYFDQQGLLKPPILIRFNSENSYDILDNTDPGQPLPLFPPMMNQNFVPGIDNAIFPPNEGKTSFTSYGGVLPVAAINQPQPPLPQNEVNNGFFPERIDITYTDPETGKIREQPTLITPIYASAKEIAMSLSAREGVSASARTQLQVSDLTNDPNGFMPLDISLNGILLTDEVGNNQAKYSEGFPETVPVPMTVDFLAARINSTFTLQNQGITARSDGKTLTVIAINGEDLKLDVKGDAGDGLRIANGLDIELRQTGNSPSQVLNPYEGYDFSRGGPYTYEFDMPGQDTFKIGLSERYETGDDLIAGIKQQLEFAGFNFVGDLDVNITERGQISFQPRLEVNGTGPNGSSQVMIGGQIKVVLDKDYNMEIGPPGNNLFQGIPDTRPIHFGFEATINGVMEAGDEFLISSNLDGRSDSRNGVSLAGLQTKNTITNNATYSEGYARLVEVVGALTSRSQIARDSSEVLMRASEDEVTSTSGVILDEEAAALIKYELAYNASAQVIKVAQSIFETLIGTFR